ncbi:MAG: pyridoxal-phosphate dependent enzyme, partial [Pirellulaceae bacterium]|nr:pyridoxal-phosphate dependent enzyme [Pirellulaceae bacterium]
LARGDPPVESDEVQGNLLLDHLVGATVEIVDVDVGLGVQQKIAEAADRLRAAGKCVYQNKKAAVKPLAALSYVLCATELVEQTAAADFSPAAAYICSAGSTGAGLTLGLAALGHPFPVRHFTPIVWPWNTREDMTSIANAGAERLGVATRLTPEDIDVSEEFVGAGYGIPSAECLEAISLLARTEGILLDPSYSGKGMAALIDHVRGGRFSSEENVVFVHTGGTPALFAYRDELVEALT